MSPTEHQTDVQESSTELNQYRKRGTTLRTPPEKGHHHLCAATAATGDEAQLGPRASNQKPRMNHAHQSPDRPSRETNRMAAERNRVFADGTASIRWLEKLGQEVGAQSSRFLLALPSPQLIPLPVPPCPLSLCSAPPPPYLLKWWLYNCATGHGSLIERFLRWETLD